MIIAGIISLATGVGEFFLLYLAIKFLMSHHPLRGIFFGIVKICLYIAGILLLLRLFRLYIKISLIFFGAGFLFCLFLYVIKLIRSL